MISYNTRDERLGPSRRVKKRHDYLRIQNQGEKFRSRYFLMAVEKSTKALPKHETRIGITVTKKVDKRAVKRNYIKRQVREYIRKARIRISSPVDIVVIAKREAGGLKSSDVERELGYLLRKSGLLKR